MLKKVFIIISFVVLFYFQLGLIDLIFQFFDLHVSLGYFIQILITLLAAYLLAFLIKKVLLGHVISKVNRIVVMSMFGSIYMLLNSIQYFARTKSICIASCTYCMDCGGDRSYLHSFITFLLGISLMIFAIGYLFYLKLLIKNKL